MLTEADSHPAHDRYLVSRILASVLPRLYGETGTMAISLYQYLRWVDDVVDEDTSVSKSDKVAFVDRQISLIAGELAAIDLEPMEELVINLPWDIVPEETKQQTLVLLSAIRDDAAHLGWEPRSATEIRHYNWKVLLAPISLLSAIVNQQPLRVTADFARLIHHWNSLSHLNNLEEDLGFGLSKIPLNSEEAAQVVNHTPEDRAAAILELLPQDKFIQEKIHHLLGMAHYSLACFQLNIPAWQKLASLAYMWRAIIKGGFIVRYPKTISPKSQTSMGEPSRPLARLADSF